MTTYVFTPSAPPSLALVTTGAGTLQSVSVPQPAGTLANPAPAVALQVSFYDADTATPIAIEGATPIASVGTTQGYASFPFDASFTNGLVALVNSTSSVQITYEAS